ncbi:MAG: ATP-binding cassette domain-containing protein, partial [Verrucomicrobiota bacterium]
MFELREVGLRYGGTVALYGVDLEIREGEQVCLIGPRGAGKSRLLGLLYGRVEAVGGAVVGGGAKLA